MTHEPLSRPLVRWVLLAVIYFLAASASFSGFFAKWQFNDDYPAFSLPALLDGTAKRPFVYRQLLPAVANGIDRALPSSVKDRVNALLFDSNPRHHPITTIYPNARDALNPTYALRYYLVYCMALIALFLAMFALRAVCLEMQADTVAATLAPLAFAAILPLTMTEGGFFYDMPEVLFMALAVWLAARAKVLWLIVLTALATLNKESYLFFTLTLFPFLRMKLSMKHTIVIEGVLLAVAATVNALVKFKYAHNPGGMMEVWLLDNLRYFAHPSTYVRFQFDYGSLTPLGFNIFNIAVVAVLVKAAWKQLALPVRQHLKIACVINLPLFIAFCYHDELRNLSMLYVGLVLILCTDIAITLRRKYSEQALGRVSRSPVNEMPVRASDPASPIQSPSPRDVGVL